MSMTRRQVLRGLGGAALSLPFLESFASPRAVRAQAEQSGFAVFLRQANGVATAQDTEVGSEPERFWPSQTGPLTPETLSGRALDELSSFRSRLLAVRGVHMRRFPYADGHADGALQTLTARGPTVPEQGGDSEADGESIDHRIGAELNPQGRDSLFLYAGPGGGWLGGPCISYRSSGVRRAAFHNPQNAYEAVAGTNAMDAEQANLLAMRRQSFNDLVRDQLQQILRHPRLSTGDRERLELHLSNIRDIETQLVCRLEADRQAALDGVGSSYESADGGEVWDTVRLHMDVAAMAIACGYTRSVAIQVGNGNDGATRYLNEDGSPMGNNYHYVSHRRASHDNSGALISNSDYLHHVIDRQFARAFLYLLERLDAYSVPGGGSLLDQGVAVWHNDNGHGPAHSVTNVPFILAGNGGGFLRQGEYIDLGDGEPNHHRMLATIANAAGLRKPDGGLFDSFGDPTLGGGVLDPLHA